MGEAKENKTKELGLGNTATKGLTININNQLLAMTLTGNLFSRCSIMASFY